MMRQMSQMFVQDQLAQRFCKWIYAWDTCFLTSLREVSINLVPMFSWLYRSSDSQKSSWNFRADRHGIVTAVWERSANLKHLKAFKLEASPPKPANHTSPRPTGIPNLAAWNNLEQRKNLWTCHVLKFYLKMKIDASADFSKCLFSHLMHPATDPFLTFQLRILRVLRIPGISESHFRMWSRWNTQWMPWERILAKM